MFGVAVKAVVGALGVPGGGGPSPSTSRQRPRKMLDWRGVNPIHTKSHLFTLVHRWFCAFFG